MYTVPCRKVFALAAVVLAAVVSICACSSGSSNSSAADAGSPGSASSAAAPTGTPVTVGVLCSCSGPVGSTVSVGWTVVQDWAKAVNAAGGLDGHPVKLIEKDNASSPGTALSNAQAIVADKVDLIIDLDVLDSIWQKAADGAKIPVIGGNISSTQFFTDPNWYPSGTTNESLTYSTVATAKEAGASTLAYLYCDDAAQCAQTVPLAESAFKSLGGRTVYTASVSATAPNYTAQCLAAEQGGAKAVFLGDATTVIARIAQDCGQQGYDPVYVTEGVNFSNQTLTSPGLNQNLWSSFPVLPYFSTNPAVTEMNAALDKYSPGVQDNDLTWTEFAVQSWTAGLLLQQAVKNADIAPSATATAADITKGLNSVKDDTLGGFSPPLTFTAGQAHPVNCWYVGRVQNGKATQVGGLTCEKS